ncbi:MAG TPA: AAC(3) family N-acetyltransferase [Polyangia bacterium]|jgi:aminoglycoside 3-N-acetyltransferase
MHTASSLAGDLDRLGVPRGGVLVVHSGYRALGPVEGGPATVAHALACAAGADGTVLAPAFTTDLIDPATWPVPPAPAERARLMAAMPLFDPDVSPPHKMGAIAQALWRLPGVRRSRHPVTSWVALGPRAEELLRDHDLEDPEGLGGPVGRAYQADAQVLLLGVAHDANTTIHLAESLLDMPHLYALPDRYPVATADGRREWRPVTKTTKCSDGFVKLAPHLERASVVRHGRVGDAETLLVRSRDVVRAVTDLLARAPAALLCDDAECVHCPTSRQVLRGWAPPAGWRAALRD